MAAHSSAPAWRNPWTEEPGGLQFMGSQRIGHDWSHLAHMHANNHTHRRDRKRPPWAGLQSSLKSYLCVYECEPPQRLWQEGVLRLM